MGDVVLININLYTNKYSDNGEFQLKSVMSSYEESESLATLRRLPSIDAVLRSESVQPLIASEGHGYLTNVAQSVVSKLRSEIQETVSPLAELDADELLAETNSRILREFESYNRSRTQPVINATGVVIHTNLGRAPFSRMHGGQSPTLPAIARSSMTSKWDSADSAENVPKSS